MRPTREITDEEDNFHFETKGIFLLVRRNSVEPEPVGTIVLFPFRVTGYDQDCDGGLMARAENLDNWNGKLEPTGWDIDHIGLGGGLVITEYELLRLLGGAIE